MKKILFITHDMLRTGAPKVLLLFLKWLKQNEPKIHVSVLALEGGSLELEFRENCNVFYYGLQDSNKGLLEGIFKLFQPSRGVGVKEIVKKGYDVIYANTIVSVPAAVKIGRLIDTKVLLHLHELNTVIQSKLPNFKNYISGIDKVIAVSDLTANNLICNYGVSSDKVKVIYEFSEPSNRTSEKIYSETLTVGGSGWTYWRKGPDIFLQVANFINKKYPSAKIRFTWVGNLQGEDKVMIESDIQKSGLDNTVEFVGEQIDPFPFFKEFDVFILTSREDPFPLVCIEVANLEIPIICFEGASGTTEILMNGGGRIVPYMDIERMAEKIMQYYMDRKSLVQDGKNAKKLFSRFNCQTICPLILDEILDLY